MLSIMTEVVHLRKVEKLLRVGEMIYISDL